MVGGLIGGQVDSPAPSGRYYVMAGGPDAAAQGGQQPGGAGGLTTTTNQADVGQQSVHSHLDSFFDQSGWTREDVLVVAAIVQLLAWSLLLYLEVSD